MSKSVSPDSVGRVVVRECVFNPLVDIQEVEQFGFVNLPECYEKGILPGAIDLNDESFNGVQVPGTLISRSQDVFDGLRKANYVKSFFDKVNAEEREKLERQLENRSEHEDVTASQ